jgi:lipoyl(octanoyl) transferase
MLADVTGELVFAHTGFGAAAVPYRQAWELQRRLHEQRAADEIPDTCLLLEHPPVYTAGKRTEPGDRPAGDPGAPVIDVDRGGKITWHGPGQLVGYPIIKLPDPIDVIAYVRALERALIRICADFGVTAQQVDGRSGAWVLGGEQAAGPQADGAATGAPSPDRKVAAIGARVSRGVTMHGFALNCDCDLSWFDRIVPCGIRDAGVTSLSAETGWQVTVAGVLSSTESALADALGARHWRRVEAAAPVLAG